MTEALMKTKPAADVQSPAPNGMLAWVLGDPGKLTLEHKLLPVPKASEVLVRIDAVAICATDLDVIKNGPPASGQNTDASLRW